MRLSAPLSCLALLAAALPAPAQQTMLDLLPEKTEAAVTVRDLSEFTAKGDKLFEDIGVQRGIRLSAIFDFVYGQMNLGNQVDRKKPGAILLVHPEVMGWQVEEGKNYPNILSLFTCSIPVRGKEAVAALAQPGAFAEGKPFPLRNPGPLGGTSGFFSGSRFYLGNEAKVVEYAATAPRFAKRLSKDEVAALNRRDMLIQLGSWPWREMWKNYFDYRRDYAKKLTDPEEERILRDVYDAMLGVDFALGGVTIDDGLDIGITAAIDPKNKAAKALLTKLRVARRPSGLHGLPAGDILFAQAASGDGSASSALAGLFFDEFLRGLVQTEQFVSAAERPLFVGLLREVWQQLEGNRVAMYQNPDPLKHGAFSLVAVLDTAEPQQFLTDLRTLAKIADGTGLSLDGPPGPGQVDVQKLIDALGSESYRTRARAELQLRLAGEGTLPYLEKAKKSADPETAARAAQLHQEIAQLAKQRRDDALGKDFVRTLRPTFAWVPGPERRAGHVADVIRVRLPDAGPEPAEQMNKLFGPQWHNIRVVMHGRQIVMMLGSDLDLFDRTLRNLDKNDPGLAAAAWAKEFYQGTDRDRRFELHVSMRRFLSALDPTIPAPEGAAGVSSVNVSVGRDRLRVGIRLPTPELKVMAKSGGW